MTTQCPINYTEVPDNENPCDKWWPVLCYPYFDDLDKSVIPPYWIVALGLIIAGVITVICGFFHIAEIVSASHDLQSEKRDESPWKNIQMISYFGAVMSMFAFASCVAGLFSSYIHLYGMCSTVFDLSPKEGK